MSREQELRDAIAHMRNAIHIAVTMDDGKNPQVTALLTRASRVGSYVAGGMTLRDAFAATSEDFGAAEPAERNER